MRFVKTKSLYKEIYHTVFTYPAPSNLNYWWNFGSLAMLCLVLQIITGIFLAMHYTPHADLAFVSVEHIMRDVNFGWLLRYMHLNGASFFFLVVYIHMFRGIYYGSYNHPREVLWMIGVIILLLMILTAFLGYVLPWGQMSFWAATVITNLASAAPIIGTDIVLWLWGGFSVDNATLNRFFSLHYLFPFIIMALVILHIIFLHENGSNNSLGITSQVDQIVFPYYIIKDIYGIIIFGFFYSYFIFFEPNVLGHPDNYIPANPMATPAHIVPEWYFLPFYAILRSVPNKRLGVVLLLLAIIILLILPFLSKSVYIRSFMFRPYDKILFWIFFFDCILLGWIGGKPIETPYYELGQFFTSFYFIYLSCLIPLIKDELFSEKIFKYFGSKIFFIRKEDLN
jgi:quinol-cytochrome oxidoreductase complex cytochrome b subunit